MTSRGERARIGVLVAAVWLAGPGVVSAQTRCPADVLAALDAVAALGGGDAAEGEPPGLEALHDRGPEPEGVACAFVGDTAVLAGVLVVPHRSDDEDEDDYEDDYAEDDDEVDDEVDGAEASEPPADRPEADDVWLRVSTAAGVLDVRIDALLRPFGDSVGWVDLAEVEIDRMAGTSGYARVRVITRFGEDYGATRETRLLVDVSAAPRLVYAGPASEERSALDYCVAGRVVRWTVRDGVLRVRTRVYLDLVEENRPDEPGLEESIREGCTRPRAFRADVPLE